MDKITQAIEFAKQNPDSQYATELRKRIESGSLDKELSKAGLSETYGRPQQESVLKTIAADPFRTLIEKPAQNLASAIGTGVGKVVEATGNKELGERIIDASLQPGESVIGGEVKPDTTTRENVGSTLKIGSYLFPYGKVAGALGGGAVGNIASGATGGYLADVGVNLSDTDKTVGKSLVPGVGTALGAAIPTVGAGIKSARTLATKIKPTKSVDETIGKIIQGTTEDIPQAKQALSNIDISGVKTRGELSEKLSAAKEQLMNTVDQELAKDTRLQSLDYFTTRQTNKAGGEVKTDNITNAFNDLKELFTQTADDLSLSNLELLQQKAINEGLTRQEVNSIARMYSQEFGSKAFNKVGDPLTSVTAQRFENTRKALKDVARGGLGFGDEAAQADRLYSAMENTQRLIDKGVEGVNKLQQRVQERGILEKLSRNAVNFLNTLSGGSLKGAASAVFPSNVGLKTLNWLDLEKQLGKDLEIISKANSVKSDSALVKLLNTMKFPGDEAVDDISKRLKVQGEIPKTKLPRDTSLTGQDAKIQEASIAKYEKNPEGLVDEYLSKYTGSEGKIINTDEARKLFKDIGYKGSNSAAVQEASSAVAKDAWRKLLSTTDKKDVLIYAGGSGTGKTSAVKNIFPEEISDAGAVLDGNLSSMKSAIERIKEAKNAGKDATIIYVYREPTDAWIKGVIKRMKGNADEGGRIVPLSVFMQNHSGSYNVVKDMLQSGVPVKMVDNSLGKGNQTVLSIPKFNSIKYQSDLRQKLLDLTKKEYAKGTITKEQYEALIK